LRLSQIEIFEKEEPKMMMIKIKKYPKIDTSRCGCRNWKVSTNKYRNNQAIDENLSNHIQSRNSCGRRICAFSEKLETENIIKPCMVKSWQNMDTQNQVAAPAGTGDLKGTREKILATPTKKRDQKNSQSKDAAAAT